MFNVDNYQSKVYYVLISADADDDAVHGRVINWEMSTQLNDNGWAEWLTRGHWLLTRLFSPFLWSSWQWWWWSLPRTGGFDTIDVLHHNSVSANMCKSMESEFPTKIIGCKIPSFFAIFNWAKYVGATKVSNYRTIILWL